MDEDRWYRRCLCCVEASVCNPVPEDYLREEVLYDIALLLEEIDERQEELSLVPILVKVGWVAVTSRQQHNSSAQQLFEKPTKNGCISNVGHLELVKI